jgi:hypothetical protein
VTAAKFEPLIFCSSWRLGPCLHPKHLRTFHDYNIFHLWRCGTFCPQKLALTSLTNYGLSVDIVRSRTQATELFCFVLFSWVEMKGDKFWWVTQLECGAYGTFVGKYKGKHSGEDINRSILKLTVKQEPLGGLDLPGSKQELEASCCECGNELLSFVRRCKFLTSCGSPKLPNKDFLPVSYSS